VRTKVVDTPMKGILELLERVGVRVSMVGVRVLVRNFYSTKEDPTFMGCRESIRLPDFLEWLPSAIQAHADAIAGGNELLKSIFHQVEG
jgi:hypothetical protein